MANERYVEQATLALKTRVSSGIAGALTTVRTAQSLTSAQLPDPVAVLYGLARFDNRAPLLCVAWESGEPILQRGGFWEIDCVIGGSFVSNNASTLEDAQRMRDRYVTAVHDLLRADTRLSSTVTVAAIGRVESDFWPEDAASLRTAFFMAVKVRVQNE